MIAINGIDQERDGMFPAAGEDMITLGEAERHMVGLFDPDANTSPPSSNLR